MQAASVGHLQLAEASVFFGVMARTFTYGSYALFVNFAFEQKYFGTLMGFTSVFCGLISLSNDSMFAFIIDKEGLDRNFVPVDVSIVQSTVHFKNGHIFLFQGLRWFRI